jgi:hypothetical protein
MRLGTTRVSISKVELFVAPAFIPIILRRRMASSVAFRNFVSIIAKGIMVLAFTGRVRVGRPIVVTHD